MVGSFSTAPTLSTMSMDTAHRRLRSTLCRKLGRFESPPGRHPTVDRPLDPECGHVTRSSSFHALGVDEDEKCFSKIVLVL